MERAAGHAPGHLAVRIASRGASALVIGHLFLHPAQVFAPGPRADLDEDEQAWTWVIRSFEGRLGLQMDTLRRFNEKFRPRWVPRRIAFRSPVDLPAIALATLSAEGFLPFDSGRSPAPTVRA